MTDEKQTETPQASEATEVEYLEHTGDPVYGTEFLTSHTITPAQAKQAGWLVDLKKDLVWTKRVGGRFRGRMLLPTSDMPEGVKEELAGDPTFKVVTLKQ